MIKRRSARRDIERTYPGARFVKSSWKTGGESLTLETDSLGGLRDP